MIPQAYRLTARPSSFPSPLQDYTSPHKPAKFSQLWKSNEITAEIESSLAHGAKREDAFYDKVGRSRMDCIPCGTGGRKNKWSESGRCFDTGEYVDLWAGDD